VYCSNLHPYSNLGLQVELSHRVTAFAQLLQMCVGESGGAAHSPLARLAVTFITTQLQVGAHDGLRQAMAVQKQWKYTFEKYGSPVPYAMHMASNRPMIFTQLLHTLSCPFRRGWHK
jgi:hypothetical protein